MVIVHIISSSRVLTDVTFTPWWKVSCWIFTLLINQIIKVSMFNANKWPEFQPNSMFYGINQMKINIRFKSFAHSIYLHKPVVKQPGCFDQVQGQWMLTSIIMDTRIRTWPWNDSVDKGICSQLDVNKSKGLVNDLLCVWDKKNHKLAKLDFKQWNTFLFKICS